MKCRNCGLPRSAHRPGTGADGRKVLFCPNNSGETFPAMLDYKIELHYRAGEDSPWVATWSHPIGGDGEAVADRPADALDRAGRAIEQSFEEKSPDVKALDEAIKR
jgi:hypothetical protein